MVCLRRLWKNLDSVETGGLAIRIQQSDHAGTRCCGSTHGNSNNDKATGKEVDAAHRNAVATDRDTASVLKVLAEYRETSSFIAHRFCRRNHLDLGCWRNSIKNGEAVIKDCELSLTVRDNNISCTWLSLRTDRKGSYQGVVNDGEVRN